MRHLKLPLRPLLLVAVMTAGLSAHSHAADSASLEWASGNQTQMLRLGVQWAWQEPLWQGNDSLIGGYWDLTLAHWREQRYKGRADTEQEVISVGITPVLRFQQSSRVGFYAEAGIGLHLLSEPYDNNGHVLSGNLQFGDHIGLGYVFKNQVDLSLKIQHFSNGGTQKPNDGTNFVVIKLGRSF